MKRFALALALVVSPVAADPAPPSPTELALRRLPAGFAVCRPEGAGEDFLCGKYAVFENRATRTGRKIELNLVIIPARAEKPEADALFMFEGGPGGAVTEWAPGIPADFARVLAKRDIVLVDQRGTGGSHPLQCDLGVRRENPQTAYRDPFPLEGIKVCRRELEKIADLTQYTTSIAMDDIEEVRSWLGYPKINLLGGSYGTRAAQVFVRRHPASVRAVVLTGFVGMNHRLPLYHARDGQRALDLLFSLCAQGPCGEAFPNLRAELEAVLERLETMPGKATVENVFRPGERVELAVERRIFGEALRSALYTVPVSTRVPWVIHRAYLGDFAPFFELTMGWRVGIELGLAHGMYLSVACAEDTPFITDADEAFEVAGTFLGDVRTRPQRAACREWPRAEIPADFHQPLRSDAPILILEGNLDPVTPPIWAYAAVATLPNARVVTIEGGHHGFGGLEPADCISGITDRFLETADAKSLDVSCVGRLARPAFVVGE
jgi:pimeloyl-ACP methyl ester carboxylesterase